MDKEDKTNEILKEFALDNGYQDIAKMCKGLDISYNTLFHFGKRDKTENKEKLHFKLLTLQLKKEKITSYKQLKEIVHQSNRAAELLKD